MSEAEDPTAALLAYCQRLSALANGGSFSLSREEAGLTLNLDWTSGHFYIMRLRQMKQLVLVKDGGTYGLSRYRLAETPAERNAMNINVPGWARDHFFEEPPAGAWEFWSFRFPPPCKVGDAIVFKFDGVPVARATVAKIEGPGQSSCDRTGRFGSGHKVYWTPESFVDLRGQAAPAEKPGATDEERSVYARACR